MAKNQYPIGLDGRMRDKDGDIHRKRGDTHMGTIERVYNVDLGVRSDMRLDTYLERVGAESLTRVLRGR